jgi:hypothetical protein
LQMDNSISGKSLKNKYKQIYKFSIRKNVIFSLLNVLFARCFFWI